MGISFRPVLTREDDIFSLIRRTAHNAISQAEENSAEVVVFN